MEIEITIPRHKRLCIEAWYEKHILQVHTSVIGKLHKKRHLSLPNLIFVQTNHTELQVYI